MWRDGVSPVSSGARTRLVKTAVVGWATALAPAAGCGANHDGMTSSVDAQVVERFPVMFQAMRDLDPAKLDKFIELVRRS